MPRDATLITVESSLLGLLLVVEIRVELGGLVGDAEGNATYLVVNNDRVRLASLFTRAQGIRLRAINLLLDLS